MGLCAGKSVAEAGCNFIFITCNKQSTYTNDANWSSPSHWSIASTTQSLEETLWAPMYPSEGDWYLCSQSTLGFTQPAEKSATVHSFTSFYKSLYTRWTYDTTLLLKIIHSADNRAAIKTIQLNILQNLWNSSLETEVLDWTCICTHHRHSHYLNIPPWSVLPEVK